MKATSSLLRALSVTMDPTDEQEHKLLPGTAPVRVLQRWIVEKHIYIYIYTGIKYIIAAGNRTLHIRPVILNVLNYTAFRLLYLWFYSKAKEPKMKYSVKDALEQSSKTTGLVTWLKYPVLLLLFIQTGSSA